MSKKLLVAGVMLALVATVVGGAVVANAQSVTCANIGSMLTVLGITDATKVAQANAALGCSAAVAPTTASFTRNLTVGSTGADVTALQTKLGVTPATGYFGAITKAAVVAYQTANGLPATGYVGPMTLAKLNAGAVVVAPGTPAAGCPAGMTCTPVVACPAGYTCTASNGSVSTTGVEGTLTVKSSTLDLPSTIYKGDSKVGVMALKAEAKLSDINIQRVKISLGTSTDIYRKVFNKIYVLDGSTVVASSDLNSNTVVKESDNTYTITLSGLNLVVAKDASKVLTIAVDVNESIDSTVANTARVFTMLALGVRGVDGAGIDHESPTTAFPRTISSISAAQIESATLKVSTNSATPAITSVVASAGTDKDEADKIVGLVFNLKAEKDAVTVTDLTVTANGTAVNATGIITTAYLYDGSTMLSNAEVTGSSTTNVSIDFTDIADLVVSKDTTKVLTVKFDVRNATTSEKSVTFSVANANISDENSLGDSVTTSGSAAGNAVKIVSSGPVLTLTSKNLTKETTVVQSTSTVTYKGTFNFKVLAGARDVVMGKVASSSPFAAATSFAVYQDGVIADSSHINGYSSMTTSFNDPSTTVTDAGSDNMLLADGNEVDIPVTITIVLINPAAGHTLAVQVKDILGLTYMATQSDWRTSAI
ncbi:MAG: peptidoglycan-binding protein [bacterium]